VPRSEEPGRSANSHAHHIQ